MSNPFEDESIEPEEEEEEQRVQQLDSLPDEPSRAPVIPTRSDIINAVEAEDLRGERAEKMLEPMELEQTEAIPRRRGNFTTDALKQKIKETKIDSGEVAEKGLDAAEKAGVNFLHHIPIIGLFFAYFAKRKVGAEIKETAEQLKIVNQAWAKSAGNQNISVAHLASTLDYAQHQLLKRSKKLARSSFATDIQTIGAGVSSTIILAPVGSAIATVGTGIKGFQGLKSVGNFFRKLYNRTLGVERNQHAMLLYGLALEYLQFKQQVAPYRDIDAVNKSLNLVGTLGSIRDREQAREQAFGVLQKLGITSDPDFAKTGFQQIRELLKS